MSSDRTKTFTGKFPPGNETMTALDTRLYNLYVEVENLHEELYRDRNGKEKPTMKCHMNFPCEIGNLSVDLHKIAILLTKGGTHDGKRKDNSN
jgi:hypothetical protein